MKPELNSKLAYWLGVLHSDGYFKKQNKPSRRGTQYSIVLSVCEKSLPMLYEFARISRESLGCKGTFYKASNGSEYSCFSFVFGCNRILPYLEENSLMKKNPPVPAGWIRKSNAFFGAYLAGLIDGDGDVRVSRPNYPQHKIRISGSAEPTLLIKDMKRFLSCSVFTLETNKINHCQGKTFISHGHTTEFAISKKNSPYLRRHVIPHIQLQYKKVKLLEGTEKWIKKLGSGARASLRAVPGI